jgi:hypothetical protein
MYHTCAYSANTNNQSNYDMAAVSDQILTIQNNHFLPDRQLYLFGGWFSGTLLSAMTLVTPRSRQIVPPRLWPTQLTTLPPDRPHIFDRRTNPFTLNAVEEISMQANIGGSANAITTAILFMGPSIDPTPGGDIYDLHGTSSTAAVSGAWTDISITWDQTLPAGTYTLIGSQHQSTNAIAHRWIVKGQWFRPGFLSVNAVSNISEPSLYYGGWGAWGQFTTTTFPTLQVYVNGTDSSHDVNMFMIKVS